MEQPLYEPPMLVEVGDFTDLTRTAYVEVPTDGEFNYFFA